MKQYILISFFCCLFFPFISFAQTDAFEGTWQMQYFPVQGKSAINMELQVSAPEKNMLYPAVMKLQYDSFAATYQLLASASIFARSKARA